MRGRGGNMGEVLRTEILTKHLQKWSLFLELSDSSSVSCHRCVTLYMKNNVIYVERWKPWTRLLCGLGPHWGADPASRLSWLPWWLMELNLLHACNPFVGNSDLADLLLKMEMMMMMMVILYPPGPAQFLSQCRFLISVSTNGFNEWKARRPYLFLLTCSHVFFL